MYIKLTLQEKLKDERTSRHMTLAELEKATGIAKATLGKYESDNCTDISPFNLAKLAEYYGLSMDYLMGLTENKNHPNTSLYELHLDDSTVDLLKSGAMNNRLLCELVCHPGFLRLMTDIEICIDRIADMRVQDMNLLLEKQGSPSWNSTRHQKMTFICVLWSWGRSARRCFSVMLSMMTLTGL